MQIPTPAFDRIFAHQGYGAESDTYKVTLALFGRLIYDVGEKDNWQIMIFLLGFAGTGKSLVIDTLKKFYANEDVGIISNNIETQFGLAPLVDKFVNFATEIRRDFKLDQAQFQSMVTGEGLSAAKKNHDPVEVPEWKAQTFFAGNEMMHFPDAAGSMARRLAALYFEKSVRDAERDDSLQAQVLQELGAILVKVNWCYHEVLEEWQGNTFWSACPETFTKNQNRVRATMNPLIAFLDSEDVVVGEGNEVEEHAFRRGFGEFCRHIGTRMPEWKLDFFGNPFDQQGIKREIVYADKSNKKKVVLRGVSLVNGLNMAAAMLSSPTAASRKRASAEQAEDMLRQIREGAGPPSSKRARTQGPG